jgi:16S rRNA C1402 N4-methylase RsmH
MDYYEVKEIDGLLADLGVSFHHFDCPERGFSFRFSAPLDMRMNQTAKRTAADIINTYSEEDLARIFWLYGEMKNGRGIARNICKARSQKPILRTEELIEAAFKLKVESLKLKEVEELKVHPRPNPPHEGEGGRITSGTTDKTINGGKNAAEQDKERDSAEYRREQDKEDGNPPSMADTRELEIPAQYKKDLARLFQALRIEVNDEMGALREMLVAARDLLKPGGRIAILTYHSLEDRLVKNFLRSGNLEGNIAKDFYGNAITPFDVIEKGRTASDDEVERNPRSRSAKLRVAERRGNIERL